MSYNVHYQYQIIPVNMKLQKDHDGKIRSNQGPYLDRQLLLLNERAKGVNKFGK